MDASFCMSELLSKLRTLEDLDILKAEVELIQNALYQTNAKYDDILKNDVRGWVSQIILSESKEIGMEKYLDELKKSLASLTILSASISFEPSSSFTDRISLWLKTNVSNNLVIDLLYNAHIIGGMQFSYKGKYMDLSLRKKISKELENVTLAGSRQ